MKKFYTSTAFDMRAPDFGTPTRELYAAALDMAEFADGIGVDRINLMEHHGSEDGYLPTPFVLGGGVAARTKNCHINLGAVILPLHDPVKLAEQIAILDIMSNGRLTVILAAGYVPFEFQMFKASIKERAKKMDQGLDIILRALKGERFEADDREIFVRPLPLQRPEDIILVGGGVEATAKRAARFGVGLGPMRREIVPIYIEECRRLGREPGRYFPPSHKLPLNIHLSETPEKTWDDIKAHALHVVSEYAKWAAQEENSNSPFKGLLNYEALQKSGLFAVWTPEQLLERAREVEEGATLGMQPLMGGLSPEVGWKSLKLLEQVLPELKKLQE